MPAPIRDRENQPSPGEAIGLYDMEMFKSPDLSSILNELLNPDSEKIALSTNIDKKKTLNNIVSMDSYAEMTESLFRNVQDRDIIALVKQDSDLIRKQIKTKLKVHKSLKGFTTNKIIEAIQARIQREARVRSIFNKDTSSNGRTTEAL